MRLLVFGEIITIGKQRLLDLKKWYITTADRHEKCPWFHVTGGDPWQSQCCFKTCGKLFIKAKEKLFCPCKTYPKDYVDAYVRLVLQAALESKSRKETTCQLGSEHARRTG